MHKCTHISSAFLKGLMKVKEEFFSRGSFVLGNCTSTRCWEDIWLGDTKLAAQYPSQYSVVRHKDKTLAHTFSSVLINIEYRCSLIGGGGIDGFICCRD
jgi:hypothetical protein